MNIVISAGHGYKDPGAVNALEVAPIREHVEAYRICWPLREALEARGHTVTFISCFQTLSHKIDSVNQLHEARAVDAAIEIHFNSAPNNTANGTEVLFASLKNKEVAARISAAISKAALTRDRGAVLRDNLGWLNGTRCPAYIVEVLFINNPAEAAKLSLPTFHESIAQAIAGEFASS